MQLLTEMDLPLLPAEQPDFSADPMPFVEAARRKHPWVAKSAVGGYYIYGYRAACDILYMDDKLVPYFDGIAKFYEAEDTEWGHFMSEMMIARHGAEHTRLRESAAEAFTPRNINRYRMLMREVVAELLDEWAPKGKFDFADFASYFPISVFCGLMGISRSVVPQVRDLLETQMMSINFNKDLRPALLSGFDRLWAFVDDAVKEGEKRGGDGTGVVDAMLAAKKAGKISDVEIRQNLLAFATAGYDTSKNMLGQIMYLMLRHPDQWQRCAEDVRFCGKVVEEALRHSGIASVFRGVGTPFDYDGVHFPKDAMLIFLLGMSSRDPAGFPNPMEFQPDRVHTNRHVGFGRGEHICIGQHLARAQIEEAVHVIAQRLRKPKLAGEVTWKQYLGVWGVHTLPITFEPAPAQARA
jgi:cytochrome P450